MRKFLVISLFVFSLAVSLEAAAGAFVAGTHVRADETVPVTSIAVNVQFARKGGNRVGRPRLRLRKFRRNPRASRVPRANIRSGSRVLGSRSGRPVRSSFSPPARDIGAGAAVQMARTRAAGEVLGVRRNGSVYDVKLLDRGRVRIVTIDAYSGSVLSIR